jgi:hypothetical protein
VLGVTIVAIGLSLLEGQALSEDRRLIQWMEAFLHRRDNLVHQNFYQKRERKSKEVVQ